MYKTEKKGNGQRGCDIRVGTGKLCQENKSEGLLTMLLAMDVEASPVF